MENIKNDTFHKEQFILEQYRQAYEQRARDADIQWKALSFGNTLIGGLLVTALLNSNPLISMILSFTAIPVSFYVYTIYRKGLYFENMDTTNIKAIESYIGNLKHAQYDSLPKEEGNFYYASVRPKKWTVEKFSLYSIMTILISFFTILALIMFYVFGSMILPSLLLRLITLGILPFLYLITISLDSLTKSERETQSIDIK